MFPLYCYPLNKQTSLYIQYSASGLVWLRLYQYSLLVIKTCQLKSLSCFFDTNVLMWVKRQSWLIQGISNSENKRLANIDIQQSTHHHSEMRWVVCIDDSVEKILLCFINPPAFSQPYLHIVPDSKTTQQRIWWWIWQLHQWVRENTEKANPVWLIQLYTTIINLSKSSQTDRL